MQTNDMQVVRVFTAKNAGAAQDNTPNELGGNPQPTFYLSIALEAGDNLGDLSASYTLYVRALSTSGGTNSFVRRVINETVTAGLYDWVNLGNNNGYAKLSHFPVTSSDFPTGDSYEFHVTLTTKSGIVSHASSNEFVTI
jgi:hypothetical protein